MINYERSGNIRALDFNDKTNYKHAFNNNKFDIALKQYYNQCINDDVWCYCDNGDTYEITRAEVNIAEQRDNKLREYLARVGWPEAMANNDTLVKIDDTDGECLLNDTDDGVSGDDENSSVLNGSNTPTPSQL